MLADPPVALPVNHLSISSITTFLKCPERWRRRYIEAEYEPSTGPSVVGAAVHRTTGRSYQRRIDTKRLLPTPDLLDDFSDEWRSQVEDAERHGPIDWKDEKPGKVKDSAVRVLSRYHETVAPAVRPVSVERRFEVEFPGLAWTFVGYMDLEVAKRQLVVPADVKTRGASRGVMTEAEAAADLQATGELFARRYEGQPVHEFDFHNLVRAAELTPRCMTITPTVRTDAQIDAFYGLVLRVAAAIAHAAEYDVWTPAAPGAWWCAAEWCGFWSTCPYGGAGMPVRLPRPRPARRFGTDDVLAAVAATTRKSGPNAGTTTAKAVGQHLGLTERAAAARLGGHVREGRLESRRPWKKKGVVDPGGHRVYAITQEVGPWKLESQNGQ